MNTWSFIPNSVNESGCSDEGLRAAWLRHRNRLLTVPEAGSQRRGSGEAPLLWVMTADSFYLHLVESGGLSGP